jgi:NADPH:quinone reductase
LLLLFTEAATLPLAAMTAAVGVFGDLNIPEPWSAVLPNANSPKKPILIYGASTVTGAFAAQFARLVGMHPIIGVAGRAQEFAKVLCDYVIDYRSGEDTVVKGIQDALVAEGILGGTVPYVFDGVSENGSHEAIARVVGSGSRVSQLLPKERFAKSGAEFNYPEGVHDVTTSVGSAHNNRKDFAFVGFRFIARALSDGRFKPHPHQVVEGGLAGVGEGLKNLSEGKASAAKYVFRVPDTKGAGQDKL